MERVRSSLGTNVMVVKGPDGRTRYIPFSCKPSLTVERANDPDTHPVIANALRFIAPVMRGIETERPEDHFPTCKGCPILLFEIVRIVGNRREKVQDLWSGDISDPNYEDSAFTSKGSGIIINN